jgi:cytochrome c
LKLLTQLNRMKKILNLAVSIVALTGMTAMAGEISGIVTARLIGADGSATAFVLVDPAKPTVTVAVSGADATALFPRNHVTLTGDAAENAFGSVLQAKAGSVKIGETNQPFKSQIVTAAALKDSVGVCVQLAGVTFAADKFDNSGSAQAKTADGATVTLLVGKGVAGVATPKGATDVFGVVVKNGGEFKLVASRFLTPNRKDMQALAATATCLSCHNPDTRAIGPSYREVAASYRHDAAAVEKLVAQMQNGGTGKWGATPMPGLKATVAADNMQKLAEWVMSYKWDTLLSE